MAYLEGNLQRFNGEGEHTGYVLQIEVEVSGVDNVDELIGERIALTGDVEIIDFPERGKELVFRATSAAGIEEDEEE